MSSVLVMGEALVDLVFDPRTGAVDPVAVPGGSPANVAVTLGRLGIGVDLVAWLADDPYGKALRAHLEASHVNLVPGCDQAPHTSTAQAHLDESGAATYTFEVDWNPPAPIPIPEGTRVAHTGSIGAVMRPGGEAVLDALTRARTAALTTYDPNIRPSLMGAAGEVRPVVERLMGQADVVKASDEDLEWLYPGANPLEAAREFTQRFGVALVVVTRGKDGAVAYTKAGISAKASSKKVEVVDTVGAGDTFMGGLIDALWRRDLVGPAGRGRILGLSKQQLEEILREADALAEIVVQRRGANPPWGKELGR